MDAPTITMRDAAKALGLSGERTRGLVDGLGIHLTPIGSSYAMTAADLARMRHAVEAARRRTPARAAAAS